MSNADIEPSRLDKRQLASAFDRAARDYESHAVLQGTVADRMLEQLTFMQLTPSWVLDAGIGTGYAARKLAVHYRPAGLVGIDLSLGMLRQARTLAPQPYAAPHFVCGDLECLPLRASSFDMVFSNLSLQWCNNLEHVFAEFKRVLIVKGLLMFSTLGPDTLIELRRSWAAADLCTHVHNFLDMHDIGDALIRAGFSGPVLEVERFTLSYSDVMAVMHDLKLLGAVNVAQGRRRALTGKGRLARVVRAYECYRCEGRLPATYEVIYGHAWVPEGGQRPQDGSTVASFPLDALRAVHRRRGN